MAAPVAPPAPAPAPSIGELWYLPGSPWSVRVEWMLGLCKARAEMRVYRPFIDQFALWARLRFPLRGPTLSVPVLFPAQQQQSQPVAARGRARAPAIRSSYDICRHIAAQANGGAHLAALFPADREDDIRKFVAQADCVMTFGRSQMNANMRAHPDDAVKLFVPPKAQGLFFAKSVVRFTLWLFGRKYPGSSRAEVGAALTEIQAALRTTGTGYLVGHALTFADMAVSCALFFSMDFGRNIPASEELAGEFPGLVEWRKRIFAHHFVGDEKAAFSFQPPTKKAN